ncbi:MAG: urate hydroxylase PuuD [Xanthomonadales bacterium]|nr:urate hydroxylase PuuD [Xanthomonadales bacterium]
MEAFLLDAGTFLLRWLHVVAAIAWIGESFYFVALDRGLAPPKQPVQGLAGESWSVHGGGFYLKQKFMPAPAQLPEVLHWSKWKSYTTWLSGFALLSVTYLASPQIHLIDPTVAALTPVQGVATVLALIAGGWFAYDALCRLIGSGERWLGLAVAVLVVALCLTTTALLSGRAAYLVTGAVLATWMSANVFFVIIPGQRRMVDALQRGESPNPLDGQRGKQRSVHNTYFTLPVVFAMLSTHYAAAWASPHNGWALVLFLLAAALIRQFFVAWHSGGRLWSLLAGGGVALVLALAVIAPRLGGDRGSDLGGGRGGQADAPALGDTSNPASTSSGERAAATDLADASTQTPTGAEQAASAAPTAEAVLAVLQSRCSGCHAAQPQLMPAPPKGVVFATVDDVARHAELIHKQTVLLRIMPPGNLTQMTEDERALIARWFAQAGSTR